jgi:hypothetical protein
VSISYSSNDTIRKDGGNGIKTLKSTICSAIYESCSKGDHVVFRLCFLPRSKATGNHALRVPLVAPLDYETSPSETTSPHLRPQGPCQKTRRAASCFV